MGREYTRRVTFDGPLLNQRWRLGPRVGSGAQARTYVARDERAKRRERVAILKQFDLKKEGSGWKNFDLFEREVRVLKSLRHPGIPRFIEMLESEPGVFNLVMAKMPGATLRAIATKVRFTDRELRDMLARLLEILDTIHRHDPPVIHRDIKPSNLIRDAEGHIALVDFGGVRDVIRESGGSTIVGTFGYMAPEQLHGQATPATDIYSLGATLVALAGKVEPEDVPRNGLRMDLQRHLRDRDRQLVSLLEAMTEPNPDQRPQSARDVSKLLREIPKRPSRPLPAVSQREELDKPQDRLVARPFDGLGDMLANVPQPFGFVLRLLLLVFSIGGYVGVTVLQSVLLPVVFALVGAAAGERAKPKIAATRDDIIGALDEGKAGFRSLQAHCLPSAKRKKRLPKPK